MNLQFFGSLNHHRLILERTFQLIREKKILTFDKQQVDDLVRGGSDQFALMCIRPSIKKGAAKDELRKLVQTLLRNNDSVDFTLFDPIKTLDGDELEIFDAQGITNLLPLQHVCFNICSHALFTGRRFIQYDTGQGKTALCLAIATSRARDGACVFIANSSADLTFRDHKKGSLISGKLKVPIKRL
jgi:hypothetical protein